ncbi:hypothetical protein BDW22DRAFT_1336613 [Trametopsis cervina]|nr:hypothetical protein BDW22DRAFT_1336613 [Trametopsis cervina]
MFASVFTALLAIPFFAHTAAAADCTRQYTVKAGDICDSISAANNVSTYQLATVNPGIDTRCSNLQPGEVVCLGHANEDCSTTYVVQPNDSCEIITSKHGINSTTLWFNNPQINEDCTNIYVGEVLCTGQEFAAPAPGASIPATTIPPSATPAVPKASTSDLPWCDDEDDN